MEAIRPTRAGAATVLVRVVERALTALCDDGATAGAREDLAVAAAREDEGMVGASKDELTVEAFEDVAIFAGLLVLPSLSFSLFPFLFSLD